MTEEDYRDRSNIVPASDISPDHRGCRRDRGESLSGGRGGGGAAATGEAGHLHGRVRADRQQQSLALGGAEEHERHRPKRARLDADRDDANEDTAKQIADVDSIIAQRRDILIFPPRESKALAPAVMKIKAAGIPVILIDRDVDHTIAKPGEDYVTFIGSDFVDQGRRAAEWLVKATNGKAKIIELEGTTGADPAIDRKKGFDDYIAGTFKRHADAGGRRSGMEIIASQTGNFIRDTGHKVMETLMQAHPDVTAVYAHNDEMAIGAIAALQTRPAQAR